MSKELDAERNKDAFWFIANYELHVFQAYLKELDTFLAKAINVSIVKIEKAKQPISYEIESEEYLDENLLEISNYEYLLSMYENFRNLFLKSFIVNLYTFLESELAERCRIIEHKNSYTLAARDLAGSGINQSMNYLIKLHRVEYSTQQSTEWAYIQNIRRLRNCITHNGGRIGEGTDQTRQLQDYIKSEPLLSLEPGTNDVVLSKQYCEKVLLTVERFLYAIDKAIIATEQHVDEL